MMTAVGTDFEQVTAWLRTLGLLVADPVDYRRIGAGHSNLTYLATDAAGRRWVLRRPPHGELLASAHDVAREARILSALLDTAVPVPAVHGLTEDPRVTDAPLLAMEFLDGHVIDDLDSVQRMSESRRRTVSASMARTLGAVHGVDLDRTGLATLASHKPYAERQLRRWQAQWETSRTRDLPGVDELTAILRARIPAQRETTLLHGDFHLRNVLTEPSGEIMCVLDWELSTLGDPLADLGSTLAYWVEADDEDRIGFAGSALPGFPTRADLAEAYAGATGRDITDVRYWYVLGLWKIAIISEGVYRRALDDPRNASVGDTVDPTIVERLVAKAFDALGTRDLA